jgi:hypothetical protein
MDVELVESFSKMPMLNGGAGWGDNVALNKEPFLGYEVLRRILHYQAQHQAFKRICIPFDL